MLSYNLIFNKLVAIVLIGAGAFAVWMEGDGTFLMFALLIGVPLECLFRKSKPGMLTVPHGSVTILSNLFHRKGSYIYV